MTEKTPPRTTAIRRASAQSLVDAAEILRTGGLVAFPTETVYGLGADATNGEAVARIFQAKGRPQFNPLIVHVLDLAAAETLAEFNETARALAQAFWPGPLTLVLPARPGSPIAELATAGLKTIALRVPAHPMARALLRATGRPVAAPSANRSGHVSATKAQHVAADLGSAVGLILDDGPSPLGLESTIVDVSGDAALLLRAGGVSRAAIEAVLGSSLGDAAVADAAALDAERPQAPGRLASHYAPKATLRLDALDVRPGEALLAFGNPVPDGAIATFNLSYESDLVEAASQLFAALRYLDSCGAPTIAIMPIPSNGPGDGLGEAIRDRLTRAAAPR